MATAANAVRNLIVIPLWFRIVRKVHNQLGRFRGTSAEMFSRPS
jgi:hypothetical protein